MTVILKVTAPNRSTGTNKTWYLSPSTEVPVDDSEAGGSGNPTIPVINSVGRIEGAISRTILHEAQGISSSTQGEVSVTLQNDPAGTEGPLDEWDDYVLDDAVVKLYIDGSVVWTGAHRGEPLFSRTTNGGGTVTSVLAKPSGPDIQLMRLAGVSSCPRALTNTNQIATAPANIGYDVTEWTIFLHYNETVGGRIMGRFNSGGPGWQFLVFHASSNVLRVRIDDASGSNNFDFTPPVGRPFHQLAISLSSSGLVIVLDGQVSTFAGFVGVFDSSDTMRLGGLDTGIASEFRSWGWVFVDRAMTESEMKSATLSSLEDEPALVSLWRGDDGAGSTIVDSGPLGNDATISGVENTDWEWAPADSGEPEQEGDLVPEIWGHGRQFPLTRIDEARNRFIASRNPLDASDGTVREGGEPVVPDEITATGIVDLSGTPSKPATLDTKAPFTFNEPIEDMLGDVWPEITLHAEDISEASEMGGSDGGVIYVTQEGSVTEVLTDYLLRLGAWWDLHPDGSLTAGHLVIPTSTPPRHSTYIQGHWRADTGTDIAGGATMSGWFYLRDAGNFAGGEDFFGVKTNLASDNFWIGLRNASGNPHKSLTAQMVYKFNGSRLSIPQSVIRNTWHFFALRVTDNAGSADITLDIGPLGGALKQGTLSTSESSTVNTRAFGSASRLRSTSDFAFFDSVLSDSDVGDLYTLSTNPEDHVDNVWHAKLSAATQAGSDWFSPIDVGSGTIEMHADSVYALAAETPTVQPVREIDLRLHDGAEMQLDRIPAASKVTTRYSKAHQILTESDLTATITDSERQGVLREWLAATDFNDLQAGERELAITVDSPLEFTQSSYAIFLARFIADLFSGDLYLSRITGIPRDVIGLPPHSEARIMDADGRRWSMVVFSRATSNVFDLSGSGDLFGLVRQDP